MRNTLALFVALAWLALAGPARAASFDPSLTWRTLETPHFRVTFHGGEEALAEEFARAAELAWEEMSAEIQWEPRRKTELLVIDPTDSANGYAYSLPVNTIVVYVTTPGEDSTLSGYDEWSSSLVIHEYTHILHLDTAEGVPAVVRSLLGRIIAVNQVSPRWVVEGFATFQETRHTTGGRGRSTIADMIKRGTALEDRFPPLGNLDGWQTTPPGGNLRYLFGQDFIQYVSDRYGENVWTDWTHMYGESLPFFLPSRRALGGRLTKLYKEWRADFIARYERQRERVEARGLTEVRLLNKRDQSCAGPTYSPDGQKLAWSCTTASAGSGIYIAGPEGENPKVELENYFASSFAWRPDGQAFAFSALHTVARFNTFEDIYFYKLGGGVDSLTQAARARDPAFSADGRDLWVVTNKLQQTQLARLAIDQKLRTLTSYKDDTQLSTPRPSPDGRYLALSVFKDGYRDLWLFTPDGLPYRRITADAAADIHPAWSADGRTLYFASDRTGIYNLYAIDLETERVWQVTNVLGGAFAPSPSPDGRYIAFESYSADGTDIGLLEVDRARWMDDGVLPLPLLDRPALSTALPLEPIAPPTPSAEKAKLSDKEKRKAKREDRRKERKEKAPKSRTPKPKKLQEDAPLIEETGWQSPLTMDGMDRLGGPYHTLSKLPGPWGRPAESMMSRVETDSEADDQGDDIELDEAKEEEYPFSYPVHRYRPTSLFPPRFVVPSLYKTAFGYMGVLSTSSADVLRRWLYSGYVAYRTDSRYLGWGGSFAINRYIPVYTAGVYSDTTPYGDIYTANQPPDEGGTWIPSIQSTNTRYWDRRIRAYAQGTYQIDSRRVVFGRWSGTLRQPLDVLPEDVYTPLLPTRGFQSSIGGGWRYAWGRTYGQSISLEEARIVSVVGELTSSYLGSYQLNDQNEAVGFDQLQLTAEWSEFQSLPWSNNHVLAARLALGSTFGDSERYGSFRLGGDFGESAYYTLPDEWKPLRGFPTATVYGNWYYLGTMEYRMPLWWIDRGIGMIPFYARYVSAAAFVDAGNAVEDLSALESQDVLGTSRVGAGVEIRAQAILGWGWGASARVGYAFAAYGEGGYPLGSLEGLYAWLGTTF